VAEVSCRDHLASKIQKKKDQKKERKEKNPSFLETQEQGQGQEDRRANLIAQVNCMAFAFKLQRLEHPVNSILP
jgi:hypothetical protein